MMSPEERQAYLKMRAEMNSSLVGNVLKQEGTKFLSEKEKARTQQVKEMLARDENPFTTEELKKRDKVAPVPAPHERVLRDTSPEILSKREKFWRGWKSFWTPPEPEEVLLDLDLGQPTSVKKELSRTHCHYCSKAVDATTATEGQPITKHKTIEDVYYKDGEQFIDSRNVVVSFKPLVCSDCALRLSQTVGIKFPQTDG